MSHENANWAARWDVIRSRIMQLTKVYPRHYIKG
jgi:hypothetical protein